MDIMVLMGLFILRVGIPVGVILLLAYGLKRLDRRWEAEAQATAAQETVQQPATVPVKRPVRLDVPGRQMPFDPATLPMAAAGARPCWEVKGCSEAERAHCTTIAGSEKPCWQVRLQADRQMPEKCFDCDVFQNYPRV